MAKYTKEQIIKQAKIYLRNINNIRFASLDSILKELGISKGVFYYHFKDKNDLLYEVIIREVCIKRKEINKKISELETLREKLNYIFQIFIDPDLNDDLKKIEDFYIYLFFENNIDKNKPLKKIYTQINKDRKSLILQQIKFHNIKITKDIIILTEYIIDTMMFYHLLKKRLKGRDPRKEINDFINTICYLLDNKSSKNHTNRRVHSKIELGG